MDSFETFLRLLADAYAARDDKMTAQLADIKSTADASKTLLDALSQKVAAMSGTLDTVDSELTTLAAKIAAQNTVISSVETFIAGVPALVQTAVAEANARGPQLTPEQVAAFTDLATKIDANTAGLSAAISNPPVLGAPSTPAQNPAPTGGADTPATPAAPVTDSGDAPAPAAPAGTDPLASGAEPQPNPAPGT